MINRINLNEDELYTNAEVGKILGKAERTISNYAERFLIFPQKLKKETNRKFFTYLQAEELIKTVYKTFDLEYNQEEITKKLSEIKTQPIKKDTEDNKKRF